MPKKRSVDEEKEQELKARPSREHTDTQFCYFLFHDMRSSSTHWPQGNSSVREGVSAEPHAGEASS